MLHHLISGYLGIAILVALVLTFFLLKFAYKTVYESFSISACVAVVVVWSVVVSLAFVERERYWNTPLSTHEIEGLATTENQCTLRKIKAQAKIGMVITNESIKNSRQFCDDELAELEQLKISQEQDRALNKE